jgi:hypothetical protein
MTTDVDSVRLAPSLPFRIGTWNSLPTNKITSAKITMTKLSYFYFAATYLLENIAA